MEVIKKVSDMMCDELHGAKCYVKSAILYKNEYPSLAKIMYEHSFDEMDHMTSLHDEVVKLIEAYRREHGEPPADMQAVYDYIHEQLIEKANKIKMYQEQYKTM